ncbi:MAG: DUF5077 domain-containing protein, partial [Opitutales bacterium]
LRILPHQDKEGKLSLGVDMAYIHNRAYEYERQIKLKDIDGMRTVDNWIRPQNTVNWEFKIDQPGEFILKADIAAQEDALIDVVYGEEQKLTAKVEATGSDVSFMTRELGTIQFAEAGEHRLLLRGVRKDWTPIRLRAVHLEPKQ